MVISSGLSSTKDGPFKDGSFGGNSEEKMSGGGAKEE